MATQKDNLAYRYLNLQRRREDGELNYSPTKPPIGLDGVPTAERNNWNVSASDMNEIEQVLNDDQPFTDTSIETSESNLDQINDAVQRMKQGDVSKYNHLPQFLREYYGRKALTEVFGSVDEFPPLTEETKQKLDRMIVQPVFRDAVTRLISRNAVDRNGNSLVPQLKEYETYLNERMLENTLAPVSEEEAGRIREKYPGEQGEAMLRSNADRQVFMAKTLFMTQLGRMDIIDEDGSRHPYNGSVAELFSHGSRVAYTLPHGEKQEQDLVYDAWRKNALDADVMFKGRFASHEMHRRKVDVNGEIKEHFDEIRIRWAKQLKKGQIYKKVTTYIGNYGMNIPLGGMGRSFNGTDCIDDQGSFGHMYMRTRKGDMGHCGSILVGFENAQPKKESCIGQLHNFKAVSHDLSCFYSGKETLGKPVGGRETDLSHMTTKDLVGALNQFELGYRTLQERSKTDPEAGRKLRELNQKLCGPRLTAVELADLLTSLGMEKQNAVRCVDSARTPKDAGYSRNDAFYPENMYTVSALNVKDPAPDMPSAIKQEEKEEEAQAQPLKDENKYQAYITKHLNRRKNRTRDNLVKDLSKVISAHYIKKLNVSYDASINDKLAKNIRTNYALDSLSNGELLQALTSEDAARNKIAEMSDKLYRVPEGQEFTYCRTMNKLLKNMVDPKGHSEGYQKIYQNVKNAAELPKSLHWMNPDERAAVIKEANMRIIEAVNAYTTGKESPRKTLRGVNTFDSVLDAVACVQRYAPGCQVQTNMLIDRINKERQPEQKMDKDTFSAEYGPNTNRNKITTWEELESTKNALKASKNKEVEPQEFSL